MSVTVEKLVAEVTISSTKAKAEISVIDKKLDALARDRKIEIGIDVDAEGARAKVSAVAAAAGAGQEAEIGVKVDSSMVDRAKAAVASLGRSLFGANKDADRTATSFSKLTTKTIGLNSGFKLLKNSMSALKFAAIAVIIPVVSSMLQGLSASIISVVSALGPMIGLLGVLPGLLVAAGGAAGTLMSAFGGVGGALSAYSAAQKKAVGGGGGGASLIDQQKQLAKSIESARRQLELANRSLERSQRGLADAEDGVADSLERSLEAQEELEEARKKAAENLEDLSYAAEGYALAEERAINRVEDARKELDFLNSDPAATDRELEEAALDLAEAELALKKTRASRGRTEEDLADAQEKGIAASDAVVAAEENIESAAEGVIRAQQDLADAHIAVADAQYSAARAAEALAEAQTKGSVGGGGGGGVDAFADAMADLTPAGRAFVEQAIKIRESFAGIKKEVQEATLPGFTDVLVSVQGLLPIVGKGMVSIGSTLSQSAVGVAEFLRSAQGVADVKTIMGSTNVVTGNLGATFSSLLQLFIGFTAAASPLTEWFTNQLAVMAEYLNATVAMKRENGELATFFERVIDVSSQFGRIIRDTTVGIYGFFGAGTESGEGFLDSLEKGAASFRSFTESADGQNRMKGWFDEMKVVAYETWGLLGDITDAFLDIGKGAGSTSALDFIKTLRTDVVPGLEGFFNSINEAKIGPALLDFIVSFGQAFGNILENAGGLVTVLGGLASFLGIIGEIAKYPLVGEIITAISIGFASLKVIGLVLKPLIGLVRVFGALIGPIFTALGIGAGTALLIVGAVAAIGAAFYLAYKHIEPFRNAVDKVARIIRDVAVGAFKAVTEWLGKLSDAFSDGGITGALSFLGESFVKFAEIAWDAFVGFHTKLPGWIASLVSWFATDLLPTVVKWAVKLGAAFIGWAADTIPDLLGDLAGLLVALGKWFITDALPWMGKEALKLAGKFLGFTADIVTGLPGALLNVLTSIGSWVSSEGGPGITQRIGGLTSAFLGFVTDVITGIPGKLGGILTSIGNWIIGSSVEIYKKGKDIALTMLNGLGGGLLSIGNFFYIDLPAKIAEKLLQAGTKLFNLGKDLANKIKDGIESVLSAINPFNMLGGGSSPGKNYSSIPKAANGGYLDGPTFLLAGEAGPEVIIPLTRPDRALELFNGSGLGDTLKMASGYRDLGDPKTPGTSFSEITNNSNSTSTIGGGLTVGSININGSHMSPDEAMRAAWHQARAAGVN